MAQRRLGPLVGGRIIGLPLTTGPFLVLLCLLYDPAVARAAAVGVVPGTMVVVAYCLTYGRLAHRMSPKWTLATALGAGAIAGAAVGLVRPVWLAATVVLVVIAIGLATWPIDPAG